jgi:hypothetical protein
MELCDCHVRKNILRQMKVIHTPISSLVETHFNIIFAPKPRCPSCSSVIPVFSQINSVILNPVNHLPEELLTSEGRVSFAEQFVRT